MHETSSVFKIPSFERPQAYAFEPLKPEDIFVELNAISEEIERCRLNLC